jgi:hypothetical protein
MRATGGADRINCETFFLCAAIDIDQKVTNPPFCADFTQDALRTRLRAIAFIATHGRIAVKLKVLVSGALLGSVAACMVVAATSNDVGYPEGYRKWQHVKSMVIQEGHPLHGAFGGIHHLYANGKAMEGYRSGVFADGSVVAFDLLEANTADNAITEGNRKVLGVMHKDNKKFTATGGWGFEGFAGDSKTQRVVGTNAATACFGCHTARKQNGFVFSAYRE